jgi:hypothetical protein
VIFCVLSQFKYDKVELQLNKLFEWLFTRVLSFHPVGPGSIPGQDMSVLGSLDLDRDDLYPVSP